MELIDQIDDILSKEYSKKLVTDFNVKTEQLFTLFGYDFDSRIIERSPKPTKGGKLWLNPKYKNTVIPNIHKLEFVKPYPQIISKKCVTNYEKFNELYSRLIKINHENNSRLLDIYINMVYGFMQSTGCVIYSNNTYKVPEIMYKMMEGIIDEFSSHIIYVDTDRIYFRNYDEIRERFEIYYSNIINYEIMYNTSNHKYGFFIGNQKYLHEVDGGVKVCGIKSYDEDTSRISHHLNLE